MTFDDLQGKVALITGAAGGIGAATAAAFLAQGAKVALVDVNPAVLDAVVAKLSATYDAADIHAITADVSQEADVKAYVEETVRVFGTIDVFFNNAGIEGVVAPLVDQTMEDFDRVMAINVRGSFMGLKYVLPVMYAKKSGSVINMSSIGGLVAGPAPVTPYVTSKFAITGLTRLAANESAAHGVRVNSVHPSPVDTEMMRRIEEGAAPGAASAAKEGIAAGIPWGRYAKPEEIANAVVWLGSDASSFVVGDQLRIDGSQLS
ncbi:MAG: SDR family oxidoreductase [Cellulomonadaceae bacterium]|jgi:NAD(P)-dependent dehydrogenase (short-subunit alcohol dehydrogenase family)|nr:SDR family oxidoreductase [Cellulomonadaceae bacterium]